MLEEGTVFIEPSVNLGLDIEEPIVAPETQLAPSGDDANGLP